MATLLGQMTQFALLANSVSVNGTHDECPVEFHYVAKHEFVDAFLCHCSDGRSDKQQRRDECLNQLNRHGIPPLMYGDFLVVRKVKWERLGGKL